MMTRSPSGVSSWNGLRSSSWRPLFSAAPSSGERNTSPFKPIAERPRSDELWLQAFPAADEAEVRRFLTAFVNGFAIRRRHMLKFRPDDRVTDAYRALNPPKWAIAHQMEIECLSTILEAQDRLSLQPVWRDDITLGELYAAATGRA